jgi:hypothetical protein
MQARLLVGIKVFLPAPALARGSWEIMHGRGGGMPQVILLVFGTVRSTTVVIDMLMTTA